MAFNKKQHLQQNIEALRVAFTLEKENRRATVEEKRSMRQYSGFGGLKFALNPIHKESDFAQWRKSEQHLFPLTQKLHRLLQENAADERQYKRYVDSMRSSVLTAFYTPPQVIDSIAGIIKDQGLERHSFLEPSAGIGSFIQSFKENHPSKITAYEKDLLTGKILRQLYPDNTIRISGFEEIPEKEQNTYDIIASNIPFGDTSVFDLSFSRSKDPAKIQAARSIHNYFFLKGTDTLRDGGILAFITSQGLLNSANNEPIRRALMQQTDLISAIRLPNNLFSEYAGTEVGSDLIILQKNTAKQSLTEVEELFCQSTQTESSAPTNALFKGEHRIVYTDKKLGSDPYGKPALIYRHNEGIEGISKDLKEILSEDFDRNLNLRLYQGKSQKDIKSPLPTSPVVKTVINERPKKQLVSLEKTLRREPQEPIQLSIFDLFKESNTTVQTKQNKPKRRRFSKRRKTPKVRQMNLFSGVNSQTIKNESASRSPHKNTQINGNRQRIVGDLFSQGDERGKTEKPESNIIPEPGLYSQDLQPFHREDCLVMDKGWIGHLQEVDKEGNRTVFHPLQIPYFQKVRAKAYVEMRDSYLDLYQKEAETQMEHKQERETLNQLYDAFVKRFGNLNKAENIKLIKTDSAGKEIPYLERVIGGIVHKADIFNRPVSFSITTLATDNPQEALAASLNKFGKVDLTYMSEISGITDDDLKEALQNRIYYNPLQENYEISEQWIAGNVVEKIQEVRNYLDDNPEDEEAKESLSALEEARPRRIEFDELDFNLGERWIPIGIYSRFASHLFDTDVAIFYSDSSDDFSINCDHKNVHIWDKYAVKSQSRTFDGIALLKHALVNTTPNITKKISVGDKEVKVRDMEAIQMANTKIDEIRTSFTDWLHAQNEDFKNKLTDRYNNTFNCFVRPNYDGSHQEFPGLDRRGVGIEDLYSSQKDTVWMIKLNKGAICDHEVGAGKTLVMCTAAQEMKRLGLAHKPMIIGLKSNVHEIAATYRAAYPHAKILYPGKKDFTPKNRLRIFGDIKNNDWDCIILTHDQFGKIPQSPEMQQEILQTELDNVEQNLEALQAQGNEITRGMLRGEKSTILINLEEEKNGAELRVGLLYKEVLSSYLTGKKNNVIGYFNYRDITVIVFGKHNSNLFEKTNNKKSLSFFYVKPEIKIKDGEIPPPVIYEPIVWIYTYYDLKFNLIDKGRFTLLN